MTVPSLLFKFRSVSDIKGMIRTCDILKNHRLYFPMKSELNDPMEGAATAIHLGYAGSGMRQV